MSSNPDTETDAESTDERDASEPLDPESLIERLTAGGVLTAGDGPSGELLLAEAFRDLVRDSRRTVSDADDGALDAAVGDLVDDPVDELLASTDDEDIVAEYLALVRADVDGLSHEDRVRSLPLLDTLRGEVADEGSPDPFVPVRGSRLPVLLPLYERAIVYTWREDCPPCDLMREAFEEVFAEPPDDVALFSVYGPGHAELLYEHYDVVGGPTTLFCYRGSVDARLTGAHAEAIVESEVRKLREAAAATD